MATKLPFSIHLNTEEKAKLLQFFIMADRSAWGTSLITTAQRLLLLGSGELGKEVAIEAMRLGLEVMAVDAYVNAPAMQVAY